MAFDAETKQEPGPDPPKRRYELGRELMHAFDGQKVYVPVGVVEMPGARRISYTLGTVSCACGDTVRVKFLKERIAREEWFRLPNGSTPCFALGGLYEAIEVKP